MDLEERPESVLKIEEVNSNIGYLDETVDCVVDEDVSEEEDEDDYETQLQVLNRDRYLLAFYYLLYLRTEHYNLFFNRLLETC